MSSSANKPLVKRRPRWVRLGLWLLALIVLLLAFHRPLILHGGRWAAVHYAKKANLQLDLRLSGSLLDSLVVTDLSISPLGPTAVEEIRIGRAEVRYSLRDFMRQGAHEALKAVILRDVAVTLDARKSPPKPPPATDEPITIPTWLPEQLELHRVDFTRRSHEGEIQVRDLTLTLLPHATGVLKFSHLSIPSLGTVKNQVASTQYRDKDLVLGGLLLGKDIRADVIHLDATRLEQDELALDVEGSLFSGRASISASLHDIRKQLKLTGTIAADGIDLTAAGAEFGVPVIEGKITRIDLSFSGTPNVPATWRGEGRLNLEEPRYGAVTANGVGLAFTMAQSEINLTSLSVTKDGGELWAAGHASLPAKLDDFPNTKAQGQYKITVPDIGRLIADGGGALKIDGTFDLEHGKAQVVANLQGNNLRYAQHQAASGSIDLMATTTSVMKTRETKPFDGLAVQARAEFTNLQSGTYQADAARMEVRSENDTVHLTLLELSHAQTQVSATGSYKLPQPPEKLTNGDANMTFSIAAPDLTKHHEALSGELNAKGTLRRDRTGKLEGRAELKGMSLRFREFAARELWATLITEGSDIVVEELALKLQEDDHVLARGRIATRGTMPYSGAVDAKVRDLAAFRPLLKAAGRDEPIGGALEIAWKGSGEAKSLRQTGNIALSLKNGVFGKITAIEASIAGTYSPDLIELPQLQMSSSVGSAKAEVALRESRLAVRNLSYSQGGQQYLTANLDVPIDVSKLKEPASLLPQGEKLSIEVRSHKLDLKMLAKQFRQEPMAAGYVTGSLIVAGTPDRLNAVLKAEGRELQSPKAPKLAPAAFDLELRLIDDWLDLDATMKQPELLPLKIKGRMPFNLRRSLAEKKLKLDAPLSLTAKLQKSQIGFVSRLTPSVRYLEGEAAVDMKVEGTLEKPQITGYANLNVPAVRFRNPKTPSLANLRGDLAFDGDQLLVRQLSGEAGGGPFSVTGKIDLSQLSTPVFDLNGKADHVAVLRNDSLTVRVNSDVRIVGPLNAGSVTGTIGVVDSRFFRDVDILPIGLPGRPNAKPRTTVAKATAPGAPPFSLGPPFSDWKFDVKIRSDTPFLVRGNLANGQSAIDVTLGGTGALPTLSGMVRLEDLTATLPFSKLKVETGYAYFSPEMGTTPRLDIQATSVVRSYTVNAYISGTSDDPQTVFSSEPPLPQEDIVALLATGTTTQELSSSPDMLAGRAAALVFQKLFRKVFKRQEPTEETSVLDRFQVETLGVGRNGSQAVTTTFMVGEHLHLVGELDVEGGFDGQIKYVMRFR